ncbi:MAG: hypothetical protein A2Z57_12100 [Planctomycetes bacterium RIFCSPHIGHO2_12_39_6]|nr:MAG: hypothetical protein A2Z57_12100 [Planctomycetes bacterium RIFCSPHIGHO2_12_39_6]
MLAGYEGTVTFYCQRKCPHPTYDRKYVPNWIVECGRIIFHDNLVSNFGGTDGVNALLEGLKQLKFDDEDYVITCDTDVIIKENPLNKFKGLIDGYVIDFSGTGDNIKSANPNQPPIAHISGQLQIIRGGILREILKAKKDDADRTGNAMIKMGLGICDDTFMSYRVWELRGNVKILKGMWGHTKCYDYEPRTDWKNIINEIKISDE